MEDQKIQIKDLRFKPYIKEAEIQERIRILGMMINDSYKDEEITIIVLLKGAYMFAADLVRHLESPHKIYFVSCSSYEGTVSTGVVRIDMDKNIPIQNNKILIVEDIIDTGKTLLEFVALVNEYEPEDISIVSLLDKHINSEFPYPIDFCGFKIDDEFVVGYGMDYNEEGRHFRDIYILDSDDNSHHQEEE